MAEKRTIARPYAQAVFGLAQARHALAGWSEALTLLAAIAADARMRELIHNPRVDDARLREIFLEVGAAVAGKPLDETVASFVTLLIENRRLDLLPEIAALYEGYRAEAEKVVQAEVIAACPVSDQQRKAIGEALEARLGRKVELTARTDESLLGGVIIRAGDMVIDGSVKGHLDRLSQALSH